MEDEEGILEVSATENSTTLMPVSTIPATTGQFKHTLEFRRHFIEFFHLEMLTALRLTTKPWLREIKNFLRRIVRNGDQRGEILVLDGKYIGYRDLEARKEGRKRVTQVIFLVNTTKVSSCCNAINLVVIDIPGGVEEIGENAFYCCHSLNKVSFPKTFYELMTPPSVIVAV